MAELSGPEPDLTRCCSPEAEQACCEPKAKAACCGDGHAQGCGCDAGEGSNS